MKHIITKEVKDYLEREKPERFYSYALFKNIFNDDTEVSYNSFRKVLSRMEKDGSLKFIGKGLYENTNGCDSDYLINEFINDGRGVYVQLKDIVPNYNYCHDAIFTSIAGSNGLYLPDNTKVIQCDIAYTEKNKEFVKYLYAFKRLDYTLFMVIPNISDLNKQCFDMDVFNKVDEMLRFKDSSKRFLLKQLAIN